MRVRDVDRSISRDACVLSTISSSSIIYDSEQERRGPYPVGIRLEDYISSNYVSPNNGVANLERHTIIEK